MSRSRKKNPVVTHVKCKSQKTGKQQCNKRFRSIKLTLKNLDRILPFRTREVMDVWSFEGDGKFRMTELNPNFKKIYRK